MLAKLLICCLFPCVAHAESGLDLSVVGKADVVFDWARDRCATWDIPDAPARAWRTAEGGVALLTGAEATRASWGPSLDHLTRACQVLHRGAGSDDPAAWNDRTWIAAVHTRDGRNLIALGHMEYHGHERTDSCPSRRYAACWFNAVVELQSRDGGHSFSRAASDPDLVAALPEVYRGEAVHRMGFFNPSNVLSHDGYLFAFVFAEAAGPQRRGPCLIRRPVTGKPGDWRAWDGAEFSVQFVDPYREPVVLPAEHACHPVAGLQSTVSSVVRHEPSGLFIAVTPMRAKDGTTGVFWASSPDLVDWSKPRLLYEAPLLWHRNCEAPFAYAYPSLIDPNSPSPAFETTDDDLWLYVTRASLDENCTITPRRDLVRLPVHVHVAAALP